MWVRPDQPGNANYGSREPERNLFRTNLGWECGNIFAGFDNWGKFILNHFDAKNRYRGVAFSSLGFAPGEWVHLAFGCRNGKHRVFINGNEAACTKNEDVTEPGPLQTVLRLGSMDFRAGDQFEGAIDELKLFDKCLTAEEVREAMESTPGKAGAKRSSTIRSKAKPHRRGRAPSRPRNWFSHPAAASKSSATAMTGAAASCWSGFRGSEARPYRSPAGSRRNGTAPTTAERTAFCMPTRPACAASWPNAAKNSHSHSASGGNRHEITLDAAPLKKGIPATIAAGFDLVSGELYLALDGTVERKRTAPVPPSAAGTATGKLGVGDLPDTDVYARTQAEGTIAELFAVDAFVLPDELARLHAAERAAWERKSGRRNPRQLPGPARRNSRCGPSTARKPSRRRPADE